jgi:hypothetical protein
MDSNSSECMHCSSLFELLLQDAAKKLNEANDLIKQAETRTNPIKPELASIKERLWKLSDMLEKIALTY